MVKGVSIKITKLIFCNVSDLFRNDLSFMIEKNIDTKKRILPFKSHDHLIEVTHKLNVPQKIPVKERLSIIFTDIEELVLLIPFNHL